MKNILRPGPGLAVRCYWGRSILLFLSGYLASLSPLSAGELNLGLNSDTFRIQYATPLNESLHLGLGWLHDSDDDGDVLHADLQVTGDALSPGQGLVAGLGGRLAWFEGDSSKQDGYALALGGSFRWQVPRYNRFGVAGELFWAPDLLTGGDAEEYQDAGLRLTYNVIRQAQVFVGARYVRAEYKNRADVHFDTGWHAGLSLRF